MLGGFWPFHFGNGRKGNGQKTSIKLSNKAVESPLKCSGRSGIEGICPVAECSGQNTVATYTAMAAKTRRRSTVKCSGQIRWMNCWSTWRSNTAVKGTALGGRMADKNAALKVRRASTAYVGARNWLLMVSRARRPRDSCLSMLVTAACHD